MERESSSNSRNSQPRVSWQVLLPVQINNLASGHELNYCESLPKSLTRLEWKKKSYSGAYKTMDWIPKCLISQSTAFPLPLLSFAPAWKSEIGRLLTMETKPIVHWKGQFCFQLSLWHCVTMREETSMITLVKNTFFPKTFSYAT